MARAVNPLLQSPATPSLPGATAPPNPLTNLNTEPPQQTGGPLAQPTDYQQQVTDDQGDRRAHDYRRVRHHHVIPHTFNMPQHHALQMRDSMPDTTERMFELVQKPDLSRKDVSEMIAGEIKQERMTPGQGVSMLNAVPADNDKGEISDWALAHARMLIGMHVHLLAAYPRRLYPEGSGDRTATQLHAPPQPHAQGQRAEEEADNG